VNEPIIGYHKTQYLLPLPAHGRRTWHVHCVAERFSAFERPFPVLGGMEMRNNAVWFTSGLVLQGHHGFEVHWGVPEERRV
jgi:hypothetical protein